MAKLEHANLVVTDIEPTLTFLKAAFPAWRVRGGGDGHWYGTPRRWLHFGSDDSYITLNAPGDGEQRNLKGNTPGLAHLGFEVASVERMIDRLREAGYEPSHLGETHPHRRNVYYIDPEGLEFEFIEYMSDMPAEKNLYA